MNYTIYKITLISIDAFVYVGSTKNLVKRIKDHKFYSINKMNRLLYNTINANGGWENTMITQLEILECDDRATALKREEYWIQKLNANLNMIKSFSSEEDKIQKQKDYNIINKDSIFESRKAYRAKNKEQIKKIKKEQYYANREENLLRSKAYQDTHKEQIKERKKVYHLEHKSEKSAKDKEILMCECGDNYTRCNRARHFKSKKHIEKIAITASS